MHAVVPATLLGAVLPYSVPLHWWYGLQSEAPHLTHHLHLSLPQHLPHPEPVHERGTVVHECADVQVGEHSHGAIGLPFGGMRMRSCGLLYLTVACSFVRIYSQPYFLSHTSATSLALSDLAV